MRTRRVPRDVLRHAPLLALALALSTCLAACTTPAAEADVAQPDSVADGIETLDAVDTGSEETAPDDTNAPTDPGDLADPDVADLAADADDVSDTSDTRDGADTGLSDDVSPDADTSDVDDLGPDLPDTAEVDAGPPRCAPPLSTRPERWALPRQLRRLEVSGGSGEPRFSLVAAPSGAILEPVTGEYVSGPTTDVTDRVRITDVACAGEAFVDIHVVSGLTVRPAHVALRPGESFRPDVSGGSGRYDLALAETGTSGATVTGSTWAERRFVAGPSEGFELLYVFDTETGSTVEVPVDVDRAAIPAFSPPWLFLPPGATYPAVSAAGSGELVFAVDGDGPSLSLDPADPPRRWVSDAAGTSRLRATDVFLSAPLVQHAVGLVGSGPVALRSGQQQELWTAAAPGDLDGDGFAEAIVGGGELTMTQPLSGAVMVYRGGPSGIAPAPAQTFAGEQRNEQLGAALAVGDFDGDGRRDLAIGAPRYRSGAITPGRTLVFAGAPVGLFTPTATWSAIGLRSGDLFGHALAACDFDGDGYDDLAVGAYEAEDTTGTLGPTVSTQGGVFLYRGGPTGLAEAPAQVLWGAVPTANTLAYEADLRFGRVLAAGDLDDDGACDLAIGSPTPASDNGVVWVHAGDPTGNLLLSPHPAAVWRGTRAGRLGWALAVGDLNGDSVADLVIGQPRWSTSANTADNHGALRFLAGGPWVAAIAADVDLIPFDHTVTNPGTTSNDTNDELGFRLAIGELTGDGRPDLVVAGIADEAACTGCGTNAGAVHVLSPPATGFPSWPPAHSIAATTSTDRQGSAIAVLGPVDPSGESALLSIAGREDSQGADLGRLMVLWPRRPANQFGAVSTTLDLPGLTFGWRVAQALEVLGDLDGDGLPEVALGTPQGAGPPATGIPQAFSGFFTVHRGTPSGLESAPWQTGSGFRRHSGADRWAFELAALADFDGDSRVDLAVVGRNEDAATSYGTGTTSTAACNVARTDPGAVAIFGTSSSGVDAQPYLMHFGVQASQVIEVVAGADIDGDGKSDLVLGSRFWDRPSTGTGDNGGGLEVVMGRARPSATNTTITCEPDVRVFGMAAADSFATALTSLGDLDGDGCDELAIGIPGADFFGSAGGAVEILFGAGSTCATLERRRVVFASPTANTGLGNALHARDLDGDGLAELVVAGSTHRVGGLAVGAAWVVPGVTLASLVGHASPRADDVTPTAVRLFGVEGLVTEGLAGSAASELFGTGVLLVPPDPASPDDPSAFVAIASQAAVVAGVPVGGVVAVHRVGLDGSSVTLDPRPSLVIGGEPGALPTAKMATWQTPAAGRYLLVGASESSAVAPFSGAVWSVPLDGLSALAASLQGAP